jgi:hypothetical protein
MGNQTSPYFLQIAIDSVNSFEGIFGGEFRQQNQPAQQRMFIITMINGVSEVRKYLA